MTTPEGQRAGEVRTAIDPVSGKQVEIRDDLIKKLRGQYACGPTLPNGEPEFGWRTFDAPPIQMQAANEIERLTERVKVLERELAMERVLSIRGTLDAPGAEACINAEIENIRTTLTHGEGK